MNVPLLEINRIDKDDESINSYFPSLSCIPFVRIVVKAHSIPHFKGLGMRNLEYEIRICQKIYNKGTITKDVQCL